MEFIYPTKFYISHLIREKIVADLEEAINQPESKVSVVVTIDKIQPYFYDESFHDRRRNLYRNILTWIDKYCLFEDVPERLNLVVNRDDDLREIDLFVNILVESNMLANKPNHFLLTNDVTHFRQFNGSTHVFLSPILYLEKYFPDKFTSAISFMLEHNYVGLPITSNILQQEFDKKNKGLENKFQISIENLNFRWNPDGNHILESVKFLKNLYLNNLVNPNVREITVTTLLKSLIAGMELGLVKNTFQILAKEFKLMGEHLVEINQLFFIVLNELKAENKL